MKAGGAGRLKLSLTRRYAWFLVPTPTSTKKLRPLPPRQSPITGMIRPLWPIYYAMSPTFPRSRY